AVTTVQVTLFQNSGFYVNVHTAAFPNGEIRGQIATFVPPVNFTGILTGDQQNPPVITNATGVGRFGLAGATLSYQLTVSNIININGAHIHQAPAGTDGPIVFPLDDAALAANGSV